jgi:hypothetical protein
MSEPLEQSLSRFTPNTAELNRDALLFAAGRASVRPSRTWQTLAGVLAVAQVLTLVCLWPRTPLPATTPTAMPFAASESSRPEPAPESDPSAWGALRQRMLEKDLDYPTPSSDQPMVPPDPPLHAFGRPPSSLLN